MLQEEVAGEAAFVVREPYFINLRIANPKRRGILYHKCIVRINKKAVGIPTALYKYAYFYMTCQ